MITAIDLCCGAGGWACAARGLPIQFLAVADRAPDCLETWSLNHSAAHPDCALVQCDLCTAEGAKLLRKALRRRKVDLILGGIPCEQVSCARANRPLKNGELETLHALIDQCFSLVKSLKPRWWCFEDVSAIKGHLPPPLMFGLPYEVRQICAADYGPQNRTRVFIGDFPPLADPEPGPRTLGDILRPGPYRTLPELAKYERSSSRWYGGDKMRVQDADKPSATVISSQGGMGSRSERSAMVPLARVLDAGQAAPTIADFGSRHERAALVPTEMPPTSRERPQNAGAPSRAVIGHRNGDEMPVLQPPSERDPFSRERPPAAAESSCTITGKGDNAPPVEQDGLVRIMEWQEAAILQGFPADYVFAASWSRTWKLVSQAIPIQVGRAICQGICADEKE